MTYDEFLTAKSQAGNFGGFEPLWLPSSMFDFQAAIADWSLRKGKSAVFADCGLGKTFIQLVWAENIVRKTGKQVLIVTPLAVAQQTVLEGAKFGIEVRRSSDGSAKAGITVTNYEKLHLFNADDFVGVVCDESAILKNIDGKRKAIITEFLRMRPYRLLCTATAAPNDYPELGTSSEALGELGYMDMLQRFFKNDQNTIKPTIYRQQGQNFAKIQERNKWRFKHHAEKPFWQWVSSWARTVRRPSDLGFSDERFALPELIERQTVINCSRPRDGELFAMPAVSLEEQRAERRATMAERCECVAEKINPSGEAAVAWCHLNDEGDLLEKLIPDAVQIAGKDSDEKKEEAFLGFASGDIRVLIIKPKIGALGLNWQHCAHMTVFPSYSFEQYYQAVRRCWRFGQTRPVFVDVVTSEGETRVLESLQRKSQQADAMFSELVIHMNQAMRLDRSTPFTRSEAVPTWL